jgi:hypothetical protein
MSKITKKIMGRKLDAYEAGLRKNHDEDDIPDLRDAYEDEQLRKDVFSDISDELGIDDAFDLTDAYVSEIVDAYEAGLRENPDEDDIPDLLERYEADQR